MSSRSNPSGKPSLPTPDRVLLERMRQLIVSNFAGRDDLNAAAESLDDELLATLCHRLADEHARHASELQQRLKAEGERDVDAMSLDSRLQAVCTEVLGDQFGDAAVLDEVDQCETRLEQHYDIAQREATDARSDETGDPGEDAARTTSRASDKPLTDKPTTDKPPTDKPPTDNPPTDNPPNSRDRAASEVLDRHRRDLQFWHRLLELARDASSQARSGQPPDADTQP